jgi:hypothetical protein
MRFGDMTIAQHEQRIAELRADATARLAEAEALELATAPASVHLSQLG